MAQRFFFTRMHCTCTQCINILIVKWTVFLLLCRCCCYCCCYYYYCSAHCLGAVFWCDVCCFELDLEFFLYSVCTFAFQIDGDLVLDIDLAMLYLLTLKPGLRRNISIVRMGVIFIHISRIALSDRRDLYTFHSER